MRRRSSPIVFGLALLGVWFPRLTNVLAVYTPYLEQSFFFDYNIAGQAVPVPVTTQCDTIHITWSRAAAIGPNPTAPYYLQVYASTFVVPFVIDAGSGPGFGWTVPFAPGTLYQICMFDRFGNTGGCQGMYTVIAANNTATCANLTFPAAAMNVEGTVQNGPMSQYGWISQCTDISILPKNGTPPFILTIAPTLHPPLNISSDTMSAINWTVALTWASPFFISLVDSLGNTWANGPLHSGQGTSSSCLAVDKASSTTAKKPFPTVAAAGLGAGIGGILVGILISYLFARYRARKEGGPESFMMFGQKFANQGISAAESHYAALPTGPSHGPSAGPHSFESDNTLVNRYGQGGQYQIEPFVMPGEDGYRDSLLPTSTVAGSSGPVPSTTHHSDLGSQPPASPQERSHVYVVHHDGGRPPVTVYTADGAEVVELPPIYAEGSDLTTQHARPTANPTKVSGLHVQ